MTKRDTTSIIKASEFHNFTRETIIAMLKKPGSFGKSEAAVAASILAVLDPHGHNSIELVKVALDVLASSKNPDAGGFLWQAAEHAQNARVRVEAVKRSGKIANVSRRALLHKWAVEGFNVQVNFQNDQINPDMTRESALIALGEVNKPSREDVNTIMVALSPKTGNGKNSDKVFHAAAKAYWNIGDQPSLSALVELVSNRWNGDIGSTLLSLTAKFTAAELKPFEAGLQNALCQYSREWPSDSSTADRLVHLAEKVATPDFFLAWASEFGKDQLGRGPGCITSSLLSKFNRINETITKALLILVRSPQHVSQKGVVLEALSCAAKKLHGRIIADEIINQKHQGHIKLIQTGEFFDIYPSIMEGIAHGCAVISSHSSEHDRRRLAAEVSMGLVVLTSRLASGNGDAAISRAEITTRGPQQNREQRRALAEGITGIEVLKDEKNPITVTIAELCPPVSSLGALAVVESWISSDDALTHYVMKKLLQAAGRLGSAALDVPNFKRLEEVILRIRPQESWLRLSLETAALNAVIVDGKVNRYALDLIQREKMSFEKGAETALSNIQSLEDANFVLDRLFQQNHAGLEVLSRAVEFHRDSREDLTTHIRIRAITLSASLVAAGGDEKRRDRFATQLHQRFQDMPGVREAAYLGCGDIASFTSIKPLRDRLLKESTARLQAVIKKSLGMLREELTRGKTGLKRREEIEEWLGYVADLGDVTLIPEVTGYLCPPHGDHSVQCAALRALEAMSDPEALKAVKLFIENTAPEGNTLIAARHARLVLEERNDMDLFEVLAKFFDAEADVLDPSIEYDSALGAQLLSSVTKGLKKAQELWEDGHYDEFVTKISGIIEALVKNIFRAQWSEMGIDQKLAEKLASGPYLNILNKTEFRTRYPKLQAHANTIYIHRHDSPTAHAMNNDGTPKVEITTEDAHWVRDQFLLAFTEVVSVLKNV